MADKKLKVVIGADISGFTKAMDSVKKSTKDATDGVKKGFSGITSSIGGVVKGFAKIAGATGAFKLVNAGINLVSQSFDSAIKRVDTLNQFPRVLQQMGYSADDAQKATTRLSEGIKGLPTTLDGIVGSTQRLVSIFGDVDQATETALALNNAFLASGASSADASRGLEQYTQMLSAGKVDMQSWRTLQETMPYALMKTAEAFGYTGKSAQNDLYKALQDGEITFDQFNDKIIELSNETGGFAEVALEASKGIQTSWANIKTAISTGVANIISAFDQWLNSAGFGGIAGVLDIIKGAVQNTFKAILDWVPRVLDGFTTLYNKVSESTAWNTLKELVGVAVEAIQNLWDKFLETGAIDKAVDALKQVGEAILDIDFKKVIQEIGEFLDKWSPLILGIAGAIGTFKLISGAIAVWNGIMAAFNVVMGIASAVATGFATAIAFLTSPIGIVVVAVGALIAIGVLLYKNWETVKSTLVKVWETISTFAKDIFESLSSFLTDSWNSIKESAISIFTPIGEFFTNLWQGIKDVFNTSVEFISNLIQFGFLFIQSIIQGVMTVIGAIIQTYWNVIVAVFETVMSTIQFVIDLVWGLISEKVLSVMESISSAVETGWNYISGIFKTVLEAISSFVSSSWGAISSTTSSVMSSISSFISSVWNSISILFKTVLNTIKGYVVSVWNTISSITTSVFNAIKNFLTSLWNAIKSVISSAVNAIKNFITSAWNAISSTTTSVFNTVKGVASSVWNAIKSVISSVVNSVKSIVSSVWNTISSTTSSVFNSIKSTATSVWNGVKNAIITPIESAKNKVKSIVDSIKGFFSGMKLSLPKISMPALPHFSLSGSFSLKPPSVPKLSVSWYETGGIATGASIVGIGENGDEAILPLSNKTRMAPFAKAVAGMLNKDGSPKAEGKGGDTIITGNHFTIREEADIKKVAQELHKLEQRDRRGRGKQ